MAYQPMSNRAGLEFIDPGFRRIGKFLLKALFRLPLSTRERVFFGTSATSLPLQKVLRRSLGGAFLIRARFTEGPLSPHLFECQSTEKYFMLGNGVESGFQGRAAKLVRQNDTVYDIGAHVGYMALLFSRLCGHNGHVFAFEPSPLNFPRLRRNIEENSIANITPVQAAASDKEASVRFLENGSMSSIIAQEDANEPGRATWIHTIRLDDFVYRDTNSPPDFVKIDIEGHAGRCLGGMQRILREHRPLLVLEVHSDVETLQVRSILERSGYSLEGIDALDRFPRHIVATSP